MQKAIISIEDRRFWSDPGIDIRGLGRAFIADLTGSATQGASTIAEQFVKNALAEQGNRTIFEKLREAAMAYHLTRRWRKYQILTQYLNSIYFGNGAYGIESAARVYFGTSCTTTRARRPAPTARCGDSPRPACASVLAPWQAALLAGMVANPSAFNPAVRPTARRRWAGATRCSCDAPAGLPVALPVRIRAQSAAADDARHRAARGAARGAVLHELAAAADPLGAGSGAASRRRWPTIAPTTAG